MHLTGTGAVEVTDTKVSDNTASAEGGGLWNSASGTFTVRDSDIVGNTAGGNDADQGGGGLYNDGGTLTVRDSTVDDNSATGTAGSGGGLLNKGVLEVTGTTFDANTSVRAGGAIETTDATTVALRDVVMTGNDTGASPGNGGGLHITAAGVVTYDGGRVTGNNADNEGGGLWNSSTGILTVTDVVISGNTAPTNPDNHNDGGVFTIDGTPVPPTP